MLKKLLQKKKKKKNLDKEYPSPNAALRAAKRENGIPVSSQPIEVIKKNTDRWKEERLDERNIRLYIYRKFVSMFGKPEEPEVRIRQDDEAIYPEGVGNQKPHFNVIANLYEKIKKHYIYKKK